MRPNEVRILTGWSQETIDTYVEQGKLKPIRSGNAKVKGGKRRRMRWFLRQDVLKIYSEDKQKR
jgi:DNA-binding transcriptional MerR regulator